jgi:hypothetical protein
VCVSAGGRGGRLHVPLTLGVLCCVCAAVVRVCRRAGSLLGLCILAFTYMWSGLSTQVGAAVAIALCQGVLAASCAACGAFMRGVALERLDLHLPLLCLPPRRAPRTPARVAVGKRPWRAADAAGAQTQVSMRVCVCVRACVCVCVCVQRARAVHTALRQPPGRAWAVRVVDMARCC